MLKQIFLLLYLSLLGIHLQAQYTGSLFIKPEKLTDANEKQFVMAISNGNADLAIEMVKKGVNPDCLVPTSSSSDITLMQMAFFKKNYNVIRFLVHLGADINKTYHFESYLDGPVIVPAEDLTLLIKAAKHT